MIGLVAGETFTYLEFKPIFAKFNMGFCVRLPVVLDDRKWGEYGVSFSFNHFVLWWQWRNTTTLYDIDRIIKCFNKFVRLT